MQLFRIRPSHFSRLLVVIVCSFFLASCSLKDMSEQASLIESEGIIKGNIKITSSQKGALVVNTLQKVNGTILIDNQRIYKRNSKFELPVIPDEYYLFCYIDNNNDSKFQPNEHGHFFGKPTSINISANQVFDTGEIVISGPVPKIDPDLVVITKLHPVWNNIGTIVTLDDPRFTRDFYSMGLWTPFDFLDQAEGGLFFFEKYQKEKIPVVFVHGVNGGPTDWQTVLSSIDKDLFQPWVLYYPSGIRLDSASGYLFEALKVIKSKYDFQEFIVVAHSMGGLVTRSFIKKYEELTTSNFPNIKFVMTINSPMNGMSAAASGVKYSPIVVPSWRDVEPNSEFLEDLHTWNWPKDIPYHLVISYIEGESGDGVVPLNSQSQLKLQNEASRTYVFNNDHVGTLNDPDFLTLLNNLLKESL